MNYVVPPCTLRNLKSIDMGANSFYNLTRSKPFVCQGLMISGLYLEVLSVNQYSIINVELFNFLNMNGALFVLDPYEDIMNMVVHYSHSIEAFFCSRRGEFVVIVMVYPA